MPQILKTMTIQEAAALWSDPLRVHLGKWEREFDQPLEGLHVGHVVTYQTERHLEVDASVVNIEVDALRALLKAAGTGKEVERGYPPVREDIELTEVELEALPRRIRTYIRELKGRLAETESARDAAKDSLRKANWAKWNGKDRQRRNDSARLLCLTMPALGPACRAQHNRVDND